MIRKHLPTVLALVLLTGCRMQPDEIHWDTRVLTPLVKSSISLRDIIQDTTYFQEESDHSITIVYTDTLVNFSLADYVNVPDTSYSATVTLDSIHLATGSFTDRRTLGQLADDMGGPGGAFIRAYCSSGSPTPVDIPGMPVPAGPPIPIDASSYFSYATLLTGEMVITVINKLPTELNNIHFTLVNSSDMSSVADVVIPLVPAYSTTTQIEDLSGKYVEANMEGQLVSANTGVIPSGTILLCDSMYIEFNIKLQNLTASSARAIFPEQTVVDDQNNIRYNFGNDIALTRLGVRSGNINVHAESTVENPMEFNYILPTALKDGKVAGVNGYLPGSGTLDTLFDLSGYSIDLSLYGDSANLFPQHLIGKLKYTGIEVDMDLTDHINLTYGLQDIVPSYVEGYIGKQSFHFEENAALDFFADVLNGSLLLENPEATLRFESSVGVDGLLLLNDLKGTNSRNGSSVSLTADAFAKGVTVAGPRLPNVGQTISTRVHLDKTNSNLQGFLALLPDQIDANLDVLANATSDPSVKDNFVTDKSKIMAFMDLELPLHGVAENFTLQTYMDMDLSEAALPKGVQDGTLNLVISNDFPFEALFQMYFEDAAGNIVDSLFTGLGQLLPAGVTDPDGVVISPGQRVIPVFFDEGRMERLRMSLKAKTTVVMNTRPSGIPIKVKADQQIRLHLTGDFRATAGGK